jgi:hypothetical protein
VTNKYSLRLRPFRIENIADICLLYMNFTIDFIQKHKPWLSRYSTGLQTGRLRFSCSIPGRGWEFFSSPPCPEQLWGPPSLLSNGYQGFFPLGQSSQGVKLTTHLHLVPRSQMSGAIPLLPQYIFMAWCLVKHRENFTFIFHLSWAQGKLYLYLSFKNIWIRNVAILSIQFFEVTKCTIFITNY